MQAPKGLLHSKPDIFKAVWYKDLFLMRKTAEWDLEPLRHGDLKNVATVHQGMVCNWHLPSQLWADVALGWPLSKLLTFRVFTKMI